MSKVFVLTGRYCLRRGRNGIRDRDWDIDRNYNGIQDRHLAMPMHLVPNSVVCFERGETTPYLNREI